MIYKSISIAIVDSPCKDAMDLILDVINNALAALDYPLSYYNNDILIEKTQQQKIMNDKASRWGFKLRELFQ